MKLLQKIRVIKYNFRKEKVEDDIHNLSSLKSSIEAHLKCFSDFNTRGDANSVKVILQRDNLFETLNQMLINYQNKINSFRKKYINWSLNCAKLNAKNYFNEEYKDLYSEAIIEHSNHLKRLISHFKKLYERYGYTEITSKSKAIFG